MSGGIRHLLGAAGGTFARLASLMTAQSPSATGVRPSATGTNTEASGDAVTVSGTDTRGAGKSVTVTGTGSAVLHGDTVTLGGQYGLAGGLRISAPNVIAAQIFGRDLDVAAFDGYVAIPGATPFGQTDSGGALNTLRGDDRDGFSTVVCDDDEGTNPQTIAAGSPIPAGTFAHPDGTTAIFRPDAITGATVYGDAIGYAADGDYLGGYYETIALATAPNGVAAHAVATNLAQMTAGTVFGARHAMNGRAALVGGFRHLVSGIDHLVAGASHVVSGVYNAVTGRDHQVHGHAATITGHGGLVDNTIGTRHHAAGFFSRQGDAQRDEYLLLAIVHATTGWVELTANTFFSDGGARDFARSFDGRVVLRDGLARVRVDIVAADPSGAQRLVRTHDLAVAVASGTATILSSGDPTTLATAGTVGSRVRVDTNTVRVEVSGAAGVTIRAMAFVTIDRIRFGVAGTRWPWGLPRMRAWPAWAPDTATLFIDFAHDRACWRASTARNAPVRYATATAAMEAFGDGLAGATLDHLGMVLTAGDTPTIDLEAGLAAGNDCGWTASNAAGSVFALYSYPDVLPAADETLVRVCDSDGTPSLAVIFDVSEDLPVSAQTIVDAGTTVATSLDWPSNDGPGTPLRAVRMVGVRWSANVARFHSIAREPGHTATFESGFTWADLSEIRLGHGGAQPMSGRIVAIGYAPTDTSARMMESAVGPFDRRPTGTYA